MVGQVVYGRNDFASFLALFRERQDVLGEGLDLFTQVGHAVGRVLCSLNPVAGYALASWAVSETTIAICTAWSAKP